MGLNKQTGNMYPFVTHTWNPIRGKCPHDCLYCYMKVYPQPELHFAQKELGTNLGQGNFIFVGSSTDMWCKETLNQWITDSLKHCREYANRYLFQSKNPVRFLDFIGSLPSDTILGTTIETTAYHPHSFSKAPDPLARAEAMIKLRANGIPRMVSIEPIIDFDLKIMTELIKVIRPEFVSVGADSKGHNLPEPNRLKTKELLNSLECLTKVKIKDNLNRLLRQEIPAR